MLVKRWRPSYKVRPRQRIFAGAVDGPGRLASDLRLADLYIFARNPYYSYCLKTSFPGFICKAACGKQASGRIREDSTFDD